MSKHLNHRVGAIVRSGTRFLLVRKLEKGSDSKPNYHVPSVIRTEANPAKALKRHFLESYDAEIEVKKNLCPIIKAGDHLLGYYVEEKTLMSFPAEDFDYGFFTISEIRSLPVDEADLALLEKADRYLPMLLGAKRESTLKPIEVDKINHMLASLRYFSRYIPLEERKQFLSLVNSEIPYAGILRAYKYLLAQYGVNYFNYIDRANKGTPSSL